LLPTSKHAFTRRNDNPFGVGDYGSEHTERNLAVERDKTEQEIISLAFEVSTTDWLFYTKRSILAKVLAWNNAGIVPNLRGGQV
jgi:hypothetical protein